ITAVVLATGYRPDHRWLDVPVTDADGTIRQHRGVTSAAGLYVVGQRFQHRRDSGFIDGARHDAHAVVQHLTGRRAPASLAAHGED
ncbi:MAG: pyridine nucleotide-disulfide oxidoreductase, partial [Nocardioides sp.]|nr:pyridine nucleotide-disulfide oxidoreductase [Nocardioides sp.]